MDNFPLDSSLFRENLPFAASKGTRWMNKPNKQRGESDATRTRTFIRDTKPKNGDAVAVWASANCAVVDYTPYPFSLTFDDGSMLVFALDDIEKETGHFECFYDE